MAITREEHARVAKELQDVFANSPAPSEVEVAQLEGVFRNPSFTPTAEWERRLGRVNHGVTRRNAIAFFEELFSDAPERKMPLGEFLPRMVFVLNRSLPPSAKKLLEQAADEYPPQPSCCGVVAFAAGLMSAGTGLGWLEPEPGQIKYLGPSAQVQGASPPEWLGLK
jgi:hypothetical protein